MAEQSKLAGSLRRLKQLGAAPESETDAVVHRPVAKPVRVAEAQGPSGGRGGKRSDPAFSPTTFFVRKETKRKAARMLEDQEAGKDLSDLVEELLSEWISKQANI